MISKLLDELRTAVEEADAISTGAKEELLRHIYAMESTPASEPLESEKNPTAPGEPNDSDGALHPIKDLVSSIEKFEVSHPELTALVNRIALALGNMGI